MLIYADICSYMLIYVDICWYILIYLDNQNDIFDDCENENCLKSEEKKIDNYDNYIKVDIF